ncbi:hypothetical protein A7D23_12110 [Dehalobacter sp. TeCB1]|jgi:hypothetical protein|uniref:Transposase n=2 Tax=Dehalobacter restrictus TaxID=55583 RepID=A0ABN4C0F9_DEHRP|nr:hypothetical protein DEHRE_01485 [Dehalobacter restrictus DSM 9455]OCZ51910.1 hypothetical protein A7D23_12110 [Dehalobacter sp. TeCB1]
MKKSEENDSMITNILPIGYKSRFSAFKNRGKTSYKYLYFIFSQLPDIMFGQYPEFLEDYLSWSLEVQEACKRAKN